MPVLTFVTHYYVKLGVPDNMYGSGNTHASPDISANSRHGISFVLL